VLKIQKKIVFIIFNTFDENALTILNKRNL